jgi:hypothetical protein
MNGAHRSPFDKLRANGEGHLYVSKWFYYLYCTTQFIPLRVNAVGFGLLPV